MPKVSGGYRFYAVAKGRQPGLYYTWEDCEAQVKGFPGAKHRKVRSQEEAIEWLAANGVALAKEAEPQQPTAAASSSSYHPPTTEPSQAAGPSGRSVPSKPNSTAKAEPLAGPSHAAEHVVGSSSKASSTSSKLSATSTKAPTLDTGLGASTLLGPHVVCCDGASKNNGKSNAIAGIGVYWGPGDPRNLAERCPGAQTNNRAELIAIVRVLETAPTDDTPLLIRTDSKYSIRCVTEWLPNWRRRHFRTSDGKPVANQGIICYIDALLDERKQAGQHVEFKHVFGHTGDAGNEGADRQANMGCVHPATPDLDWESLEVETRARTVNMKVAMKAAAEEAVLEALSDDPPPPQTPPRKKGVEAPAKRSPFKPARTDTPQFTSPTASPKKAGSSSGGAGGTGLTKQELELYADCLGDAGELEAELAGL